LDVVVRRRLIGTVAVAFAVMAVGTPALATPGPASAPEYWFDDWQVPSLWDSGARGEGITIAEIDTGVNAALPELRGRVLAGKDFGAGGNGHVDREVDQFGHGTAMASIMVARPGLFSITGLAPDAKILPLAVPLKGTTDAGRPDKLAQAIRYAADHHAKIISMSLGGKRSPKFDQQPCSDDEQSAIYYALRKGLLVVAAVGNSGPTKNTVEDPGVCLGVMSVGALTSSGTVADFSSREPYLTLTAPGVDVPSLGRVAGEAYSGEGTSQATAITAAVAALVWSRHPSLSARQVGSRILATLDDHRRVPSPAYGYGRLNADRAVNADVPANAPNPVFDAVAPFLGRDAALAKQAKVAPPKARTSPDRSTGRYDVGSVSRVTRDVVAGVALAAAGVVLLIALLVIGVRARRRARRQLLMDRPLGPAWGGPAPPWAGPPETTAGEPRG
jgi:subtilisin family serine protease